MNYVTSNTLHVYFSYTQSLSLLDNQGHDAAYITMTVSHTHAQIEEPSLQLQHKSLNISGTNDQACQCGEQPPSIHHPESTALPSSDSQRRHIHTDAWVCTQTEISACMRRATSVRDDNEPGPGAQHNTTQLKRTSGIPQQSGPQVGHWTQQSCSGHLTSRESTAHQLFQQQPAEQDHDSWAKDC
jgi:hypothetical protein